VKKFLTLAIANFFLQLVSAQVSNNQEVIGSAGEQLKTTQGSVNFTVGESVILTYINNPSGVEVNQGFQQTYFKITEVTERPFAEFNIRVWPNPTVRFLYIDFGELKNKEHIQAEFTDLSGKVLDEFDVLENAELDLSAYPVSSYLLKIHDTKSMHFRMFRIIKL